MTKPHYGYNFYEEGTEIKDKKYCTPSIQDISEMLKLDQIIDIVKQPEGDKYAIVQDYMKDTRLMDLVDWNYDSKEEAEKDLHAIKQVVYNFYLTMSQFHKANENLLVNDLY